MKKHILLSAALCGTLVLLGTVSCQKQPVPAGKAEFKSFTVHSAPLSKQELSGGTLVHWQSGDKLAMVSRTDAASAIAEATNFIDLFSTTESGAQATFTGSFSSGQQSKVFVVHPYTAYGSYNAGQVYVSYRNDAGDYHYTLFYVPFSPLQRAVANSFPVDYTTMHSGAWGAVRPPLHLAYGIIEDRLSSTEFRMHNACALLKFSIANAGKINYVDFKFTGTDYLAAYRVQINFDESTGDFLLTKPWSGQGQAPIVRVYPPEGEDTFPVGTYYAAITPVTKASKPTVILRNLSTNKQAKLIGSETVTLDAGDILPLGGSKALDTIADEKSAWASRSATLTYTMDFTQGKSKPFSTDINTVVGTGEGINSSYSFTGPTTITIKTAGTNSNVYYDEANNYLVLKGGSSNGAYLFAPNIDGRRLKTVNINAAGHAASASTTTKFVMGSNGGTSTTYGTQTLPLESAGPSDYSLSKATFPAGTGVYLGVGRNATVYLRSLELIYE
ncbi:MAG: hypothetical protein IJV01_06700 [Bacteroidales bacterium]|nr:hypothetical protein [Bacteroidales bacterium]